MYDSLTQTLARVPDDTVLFPGHLYSAEPSASMGDTRQHNIVFRPRNARAVADDVRRRLTARRSARRAARRSAGRRSYGQG